MILALVGFDFAPLALQIEKLMAKQEEFGIKQEEGRRALEEARRAQEDAQVEARRAQEEAQVEARLNFQRLAASSALSPPNQSPAVLGGKVIRKAIEDGGGIGLKQFEVAVGRPPIIPTDKMAAFTGTLESELVAFLTPFLGPCFPSSCVIVNSETCNWIDVESGLPKHNLKPDFEACHPAFYRSAIRKDLVPREFVPRFGTIPHPCLYGSVFVGAAKVATTATALGELVVYLEWMCHHSKREALGMFASLKECQLLRIERKVTTRFCRVPWDAAGSLDFVRDFFSSYDIPLASTIDACCAEMNVEVVEGSSFLGRGGSGVVFKVKSGRDFLALKVVLNTDENVNAVYDLRREFEASKKPELHDLVIPGVSFFSLPDCNSAGLLLAEAAVETATLSIPGIVEIIFGKLFDLHKSGFTHGDPRLPNFVRSSRLGWKWIDLRESSGSPFEADVARDVRLLINSVVYPKLVSSLEGISQAIENYSSAPTAESMKVITDIVQSH